MRPLSAGRIIRSSSFLKGNSSPNTSVVYMKDLPLIRMFIKYFGLNINSKGEIGNSSF
jgi:hypothetical protein